MIKMTQEHYQEYIERMEDLAAQLFDLAAEMRADPPRFGGCGECVRVVGVAVDIPTKRGSYNAR